MVLALIIGFFCVRHTEIYFAMLTLAFGMMVFSLIWNAREITGGDDGLVGIMRDPFPFSAWLTLRSTRMPIYYFLVLAVFVVSAWAVHRIRVSPLGLALAGIRENSNRAEFAGLSVKNYRLAVFVISGAFAGLAGALETLAGSNARPFMAHWSHSAEPILVSLLGGLQTFAGPLVGTRVSLSPCGRSYSALRKTGCSGSVSSCWSSSWVFEGAWSASSNGWSAVPPTRGLRTDRVQEPPSNQEATNFFGMVCTAKELDLAVEAGVLTSIIGPNGARKSTLINLITGNLPVQSGSILFKGRDITRLPIHQRVRLGICRSFQIVNIFPELTVLENLFIPHWRIPEGRGIFLPHEPRNRASGSRWKSFWARSGLAAVKNTPATALSHGDQRLLEVGVALAVSPRCFFWMNLRPA